MKPGLTIPAARDVKPDAAILNAVLLVVSSVSGATIWPSSPYAQPDCSEGKYQPAIDSANRCKAPGAKYA